MTFERTIDFIRCVYVTCIFVCMYLCRSTCALDYIHVHSGPDWDLGLVTITLPRKTLLFRNSIYRWT